LLIAISQQTSRDDEYFRNTLNVREDLSQHPGVLKVQGVEPEFGKRLAALCRDAATLQTGADISRPLSNPSAIRQ
jgi:hypothetical protein